MSHNLLFLLLQLAALCTQSVSADNPCCPQRQEMCSSLEDIETQVLSPDDTSGNCTISDDCTQITCDLRVMRRGIEEPYFLNVTLLPCSIPYAVHVDLSSSLHGPIVSGIFTENEVIRVILGGVPALVFISVDHQCDGLTLWVAIVFPTSRINFVQQANISMHCLKCPTKDNLQSSVEDIKMKVLSPVGNSSTCEVSSDFTQLICDIIVVRNGNDVPFFLNITLFPCSSPYTVYMNLSSSLLGPFVHDLFNGTWSIGAVNTGNNARAHAGVTEQCEAIILEVYIEFDTKISLVPPTAIPKYCMNHTKICEVDGQTYQIGENIPNEDPCKICECTKSGQECTAQSCSLIDCPPHTEAVDTRVEGECCPNRTCVLKCPPPCTRKLCKSGGNALCSLPGSSPCLNMTCNVTTCKACYYSEGPPRSLPTGCEKYNCEAVKDDANRLNKCLKRFGRCIREQDKTQYGKPSQDIIRPRNFKCYSYPC